jgi:predicted nucleic acid-binding protein
VTAAADTSPLLALAALDLLHLLPDLFERALIPPAVLDEATRRKPGAPGALTVRRAIEAGILQVKAVPPGSSLATMPDWLGAGEREAIALALGIGAEWVVLDDRAARRYADGLGPAVIGSVRILEFARDAGWIARVTPLLERLRAEGFYLSDDIIETMRAAEHHLER